MRPDDDSGRRPSAERPFRVLLVSGSDRRQHNCPGVDAKSRTLMFRRADRLPAEWEVDVEDLGNVYGRARIRSGNGCVSTSMALYVWPAAQQALGLNRDATLRPARGEGDKLRDR